MFLKGNKMLTPRRSTSTRRKTTTVSSSERVLRSRSARSTKIPKSPKSTKGPARAKSPKSPKRAKSPKRTKSPKSPRSPRGATKSPSRPSRRAVERTPSQADTEDALIFNSEFARTIFDLDRQCGAGHMFRGDRRNPRCVAESDDARTERDRVSRSLHEGHILAKQLRGEVTRVKGTYEATVSVMTERIDAAHDDQVRKDLRRQRSTYSEYTMAVMKLGAKLMFHQKFCGGKENLGKLEQGCFDGDHLAKMNAVSVEVLDLLKSFQITQKMARDNFHTPSASVSNG